MGIVNNKFITKLTIMKQMNFIPHTVDGIFRDLNRESKVTICLSGISGQPVNLHTDQGYSVEKVNNCTTAKEFYARLLSHCTGARLAAMDALHLLDPSENSALLLECIHRVDQLMLRTVPVYFPVHPSLPETGRHHYTRRFLAARLEGLSTGAEPSQEVIRRILLDAHRFAIQWNKAINVLQIQLISLLATLEHQSDLFPSPAYSLTQATHVPSSEKIRFNGTVPKLASLARILATRNLFEMKNKSQFFRRVVGSFSTAKQPDISWVSFRNHFDNPTPEELSFWDAELSEWRRIIRKLSIMN